MIIIQQNQHKITLLSTCLYQINNMKEGVTKSSITEPSLKSKQHSLVKQIDLLLAKNRSAVYKEIQVGELVYLMSQKWLIRLRQSLKANKSLPEYQDSVINSELVEELQTSSYTYQDHHLKGHIQQQNEDPEARIRLLRRQMFDNIMKAVPDVRIIKLERKVIKAKGQKQLQLNPFRVEIDIVSMKAIREAQQLSNSSQCEFTDALHFKRIKVNFYCNQTISQFKIRIRRILFDQDKQLRVYAFDANLFKHASFERTFQYFYKKQNTQIRSSQHQILFQTLQQKQNTLQSSRILQFFPGKLLQNESVNELKQNHVQKLILQVRDDDWTFPHQPQFSLAKNCKYCMFKLQLYIDFYCKKQNQVFLFCSKICHFLFLVNHPCERSKAQIIQNYGEEYLVSQKVQEKVQQRTDFTNKSLQSQIQLDKKSVIQYIRSDMNDLAIVKSNRSPLVNANVGVFLGGGMNNLGNTCYLNASLQILIRTKLTDILLDMEKSIDANKQCRLTSAYLSLIRKMRRLAPNENVNFATMESFKFAVEQALVQFQGWAQHDVHQFIMFFLDRLSQELNLNTKTPPFSLQKNKEKQPDEVLGRRQWLRLIQKNNSPIINLFYGQVKSQIDCPHCHTTNKKFDTFSILSISIPENVQTTIELYYESYLFKEKIKYLKFDNSAGSIVQDVVKGTMARLGFAEEKSDTMSAFLLGYEGQCDEIDKNKKVSELLPEIGKFGQRQNQFFIIEKPSRQATVILFKFLYQEKPFTLKKPLFFLEEKSKLRNFKIYNTVSLYLVSIAALYLPSNIKPDDIKKSLELQPQKYFKLRLVYTKKESPTDQKTKIWIQPDTQIQKQLFEKIQIEVLIQKFDNPQQKNNKDSIFFDIVLKKLNKFVKASLKAVPDLKQTPQILQDCLKQEFNRKQLLANGNEWFCATCRQKRRVHQTTHLYKANKYLLIQIKRFKKGPDGHFYKNYNKVRLPLELDLNQILNNPTLPSSYYKSLSDEQLDTYHLTKEINISPCTKYNLMGMILHEGKLGSGHYTAIFRGQEWIQYNDLRISKINIEKTLKQPKTMEKIYILLYERAM